MESAWCVKGNKKLASLLDYIAVNGEGLN